MRAPVHAASLRRVAQLALPIACAVITAVLVKQALSRDLLDGRVAWLLREAGMWGPALFIALLALRPLLLLPGQAFAAFAGVLWGGAEGTALALLGSLLSTLIVVSVGRRLFRRPLSRWAGGRQAELSRLAARHDFLYALLITLNPLLPTDVCIGLGAGAGGRHWRLALGATLGSVPGTIATAYFGSALAADQPVLLAVSLAGMVASLLGGVLLGRRAWLALGRADAQPPSASLNARSIPASASRS